MTAHTWIVIKVICLNQIQFSISGSGKNPSDMGIEKTQCRCISDVSQVCVPQVN